MAMTFTSHFFSWMALLNLFLQASCINEWPVSSPQVMPAEDKIRLGSTPPSCHNRCNACHPCTAVHVPAQPSLPAAPALGRPLLGRPSTYSSSKFYSNYKPLGWKCRCGDRLYSP